MSAAESTVATAVSARGVTQQDPASTVQTVCDPGTRAASEPTCFMRRMIAYLWTSVGPS